MKNLLTAVLLLSPALALAVSPPSKLREPVVVPAIGFTAKVSEGRVLATWRRYKRDDFYAYELLRSDKDEPVYVPKKSLYATHNVGDLGFEDGKIAVGTYHYRLVIVTSFGDLWFSPVVDVNVGPEDVKRPVPTIADFEVEQK
jgi:hypothetical protein